MNTTSYKAVVTTDISVLFKSVPEYCLIDFLSDRFTQPYRVNEGLTWPQII